MSLVVTRVVGLATVQDLGRRGHMHEAVPPGGALVGTLLVAANRRAGNADDAPAIEVMGRLELRAERSILVATPETTIELEAGDSLVVDSGRRRVSYLAVHGGVAAPLVLAGRGTLLCAGLGSPLAVTARIDPAEHFAPRATTPPALEPRGMIRIIAGPDRFPEGAVEQLCAADYTISPSSNRVGTRLVGSALPVPEDSRTRPMVVGAIEVPRDGAPIVLGPEHPVTGGYSVIAVVVHDDLDALFAIPLGGRVRFGPARYGARHGRDPGDR